MAVHDYNLADQSPASFRSDANSALSAIVTLNSNATAPSTTFAGMLWYDTTSGVIKQRNSTNAGWNTLYPVNNDGLWLLRNAGNPQGALAAWFTGQLCWDSTNARLYVASAANGTTGGTTWTDVLTAAANTNNTAPAVYSSVTQFTVASIAAIDSTRARWIQKTTSTTVDVSTTGLNGIAQSANLAGTASCSGTTVTGSGTAFTTDFVVGDVIWFNGGAARRITAIASATSMTVESSLTQASATYRRGGRAPNTWYNLYALTDGSTPGLILTTRNVAGGQSLVDLPANYSWSRQLPFAARLDASSNLLAWHPIGRDGLVQWVTAINALSSGTASSYTSVSLAASVPPISRRAYLSGRYQKTSNATSSGSETLFVRMGGGTTDDWRVFNYTSTGLGTNAGAFGVVPTSTAQAIEYYRTNAQGGTTVVDIDVYGYVPTEVI